MPSLGMLQNDLRNKRKAIVSMWTFCMLLVFSPCVLYVCACVCVVCVCMRVCCMCVHACVLYVCACVCVVCVCMRVCCMCVHACVCAVVCGYKGKESPSTSTWEAMLVTHFFN